MAAPEECTICAMVNGEPLGGWVYQDENWAAGTLDGLEVPGWIVLALRRHATDAAPLTEAEGETLGPIVRLLSSAIVKATGAPRVYLQSYGEQQPHWHLLIAARGADVPLEHRHAAFLTNRAKYIDVGPATETVRRVRAGVSLARDHGKSNT